MKTCLKAPKSMPNNGSAQKKEWDIRPVADTVFELQAVSQLILAAFVEFIAADYTTEGVAEIQDYVRPSELRKRIVAGKCFILIAVRHGRPVGMIEVEDYRHLTLLFVDKECHGQGIARALVESAIVRCCSRYPKSAAVTLTVHASRYAVPFYKRLGFVPRGSEVVENGRIFQPMARPLSPSVPTDRG